MMQQTAYAKFVYERNSRRKGSGPKTEEDRTFKGILQNGCRRLVAFLFTQVGVCALLVAYNVIGAYAFHALEGVAGDATPELNAEAALNTSVARLWVVTERFNVLAADTWRKQVTETLRGYQDTLVPLIRRKGYRGVHPSVAWSPPAALMYSLSVYTTIGYGNLAPRTAAGKAVTILYAIVGMPLMLLYMANVGQVLANIFKFIYFKACRCDIGSLGYHRTESGTLVPITRGQGPPYLRAVGNSRNSSRNPSARSLPLPAGGSGDPRLPSGDAAYVQLPPELQDKISFYKPRFSLLAASVAETGMVVGSIGGGSTVGASAIPIERERRQTIPITWALLVMTSYVICGGLLFARWENWTVLDGCYFCYISLSTIGFGDLVPGRIVGGEDGALRQVDSKQIICTIYLLVGMALVAMCFNLMQEEAIENLKTFWRSLGCLRKRVKRGRDRIRGKRRRSQMLEDELNTFDLEALRTRRLAEPVSHLEGRARNPPPRRKTARGGYPDEQLDRRRHSEKEQQQSAAVKSKTSNRETWNEVDAIIVSDYDREYEILRNLDHSRRTSEVEKSVTEKRGKPEPNRNENLEMKYYRDSKNKQWHKRNSGEY